MTFRGVRGCLESFPLLWPRPFGHCDRSPALPLPIFSPWLGAHLAPKPGRCWLLRPAQLHELLNLNLWSIRSLCLPGVELKPNHLQVKPTGKPAFLWSPFFWWLLCEMFAVPQSPGSCEKQGFPQIQSSSPTLCCRSAWVQIHELGLLCPSECPALHGGVSLPV